MAPFFFPPPFSFFFFRQCSTALKNGQTLLPKVCRPNVKFFNRLNMRRSETQLLFVCPGATGSPARAFVSSACVCTVWFGVVTAATVLSVGDALCRFLCRRLMVFAAIPIRIKSKWPVMTTPKMIAPFTQGSAGLLLFLLLPQYLCRVQTCGALGCGRCRLIFRVATLQPPLLQTNLKHWTYGSQKQRKIMRGTPAPQTIYLPNYTPTASSRTMSRCISIWTRARPASKAWIAFPPNPTPS